MANPIRYLSADLTFGYNSTRSDGVDPSVKTQPEINMSGGIQYAQMSRPYNHRRGILIIRYRG